MEKFINTPDFMRYLFDQERHAIIGAEIAEAILEARSPRISDLSNHMSGNPDRNYKAVQRFLDQTDPSEALLRLFQANAPFVLGDPTEMPRPQADNTCYVGTLSDGKTLGFLLLLLATPFRGRAIPFSFVTYSSRTINEQCTSRNLEHCRAFAGVKELLGDRPLVLDREFSYLDLMEILVAEGINFVIRLNLGSRQPSLVDADGRAIKLRLARGQKRSYRELCYLGKVKVNVSGAWQHGLKEALWVITNLEPEAGMRIYQARMKIEETFRDLKSLLSIDKIMNKKQRNMEKMIAMVLISYSIGVLVGESLRDLIYGPEQPPSPVDEESIESVLPPKRQKRDLYSGLFILLKRKLNVASELLLSLVQTVLNAFAAMVRGDVRTLV